MIRATTAAAAAKGRRPPVFGSHYRIPRMPPFLPPASSGQSSILPKTNRTGGRGIKEAPMIESRKVEVREGMEAH